MSNGKRSLGTLRIFVVITFGVVVVFDLRYFSRGVGSFVSTVLRPDVEEFQPRPTRDTTTRRVFFSVL